MTAREGQARWIISPQLKSGANRQRDWIRLAIAYLVLGGAAFVLEPIADPDGWWLHGLWCGVGLALALPTLVRGVLSGFNLVLTDHRLMFLGSFSVYFLFGAALLAAGPELQVQAALTYYPINAKDALRVDAVNGLGFGLALMTASMASSQFMAMQARRAATRTARMPAQVVIALFLVIGLAASFYILSFDLGFSQGVVPGVVRNAGKLSLVAVFLATAYRGKNEAVLRSLGSVITLVLAMIGALEFSKTDTLLPCTALVAGLSVRFGPRKVLPLGLALLVAGFLVLGNLVPYGRASVGYQGAANLWERGQMLMNGWEDTKNYSDEQRYSPWARLCYTPPQAAALDFWDAGTGGDGFLLLPWVFVPRLFAADKPEITRTGREFHQKITGQDSSSTGQGVFASGYYSGGWWGLLAASVLCGWILAQTLAIARVIIAADAALILPLALLGIYIAFRIDGDFVSDYIGAFVFILYPLLAMSLLAPKSVVRMSEQANHHTQLSR